MIRYLPLELNAIIQSECWTYYKIAILQKQPYFDFWLSTHMNSYINNKFESEYGELGRKYDLNYYSNVFDIEEIDIKSMNESNIVDFLIHCIDLKKYPILDLDHSIIFNESSNHPNIHEFLIFGYDTETKCFAIPLLNNAPQKAAVPFNILVQAYSRARSFYIAHPQKYFIRQKYYFPITLLKPHQYYSSLAWDYNFFVRLKRDLLPSYSPTDLFDTGNIDGAGDGLRKFFKIAELVDAILASTPIENISQKLYFASYKLNEYHIIINRSFSFVLTKYQDPLLQSLHDEYKLYCQEYHTIHLLVLKYLMSNKLDILLTIKPKFLELRLKEREVFEKFADRIKELFTI